MYGYNFNTYFYEELKLNLISNKNKIYTHKLPDETLLNIE